MNEIRVYYSIWKNLLIAIVGVIFTLGCIFMLREGEHVFAAWMGILLFGACGLFFIYILIKQLITRNPLYIITDESIVVNGGIKEYEVRFADVESFFITSLGDNDFIGIHYKPGIEQQKMDNAGTMGKLSRKMNINIAGSQEALVAYGLTIKPQELCDILNKKLRNL